jgi:hypothetical protein
MVYGPIADCTFTTPGGNIKGGDPCYHLDRYDEMSGLSPTLCEGGSGLYNEEEPHDDGTWGGETPGWMDNTNTQGFGKSGRRGGR